MTMVCFIVCWFCLRRRGVRGGWMRLVGTPCCQTCLFSEFLLYVRKQLRFEAVYPAVEVADHGMKCWASKESLHEIFL